MLNEKQKLEEIIKLGDYMAHINDIDVLMEKILTEARKLVNADAGSIYQCENGMLLFTYSQNDTKQKKLPPGKKLVYNTFKMPINESSISGYVAVSGEILNIEDAYKIGDDVPYGFQKDFDIKTKYKTTSMLTIPLKTSTNKTVGVLQLLNAQDENNNVTTFKDNDIPIIKHFANNAAVALEKAALTRTLILRMISMAELRDPKETGAHVNRVGAFSAELYEAWAKKHNLTEYEITHNKDTIRIAAMLHDVGKVAISDTILKKPGKFTDEEYAIMKQHPYLGARLFSERQSELDEMSFDICLNHHERWDGFGYPGHIDIVTGLALPGFAKENGQPRGKKGEETTLAARIVGICDVYDALSCRRVYKSAWTQEDVVNELKKSAGTQFDSELIEIFVEIIEVIQSILQKYPDTE
ncbi:MAG: HD domain-containing protein [Candidatus Cloacimonetes bacterium]|nr:HD domain-containing protein [Candidatus Cloacimonadota bacterium]